MGRKLLLSFCCLLVFGLKTGNAQDGDVRLKAVQAFILEKDYPEVFANSPYKTRVQAVLDADVDNDGKREVIVLFFPHFRQSASILIYKVDSDLKVSRVTEGLAPGPLQAISGDYLDSHESGNAVDFEIPGSLDFEKVLKVAGSSQMGGLVAYDVFYHMDGRSGAPFFVDMRGAKLPSKSHDCASFEFSRVKQIAVGAVQDDPSRNYLAAWVGNDIYVYLITGISANGLLDKKVWIVPAPNGFKGFEPGKGLTYGTDAGMALLKPK
jgi:hypothetical protein